MIYGRRGAFLSIRPLIQKFTSVVLKLVREKQMSIVRFQISPKFKLLVIS